MKILDTSKYIQAILEAASEGREVQMMVSGNSMAPLLIGGRDLVLLKKTDGNTPVKKGDILLFERSEGRYVLHRLHHRDAAGLYMIGDAQKALEGPVLPGQIRGIVTGVCRKDEWIRPGQLKWQFFAGPWLWWIPLRPFLMKCYSAFRKNRSKK